MTAICKTSECTYTFLNLKDHTLDATETLCPLDHGLNFQHSNHTLGALERLPLEIFNMILVNLDIQSLTTRPFGASVNKQGGQWTPYQNAIRKFGLNVKDLAALPSMKSVPGRYPPRGVKCGTRLTLYDRAAARQAGIDLHGSAEAMEQSASQISSQRLERYESRRLLRSPRDNSSLRQPRGNNEFDGLSSNPRRFMGLVRVPRINPRTGSLEWGDHCLACKPYHYSRPLHWRRKFTPEGLQEHLNECGEIIQGKHVDQANRDS
ncbi:hypothetical protein BDV25DRAFT_139570 [Aspergillus avenaceus]|uniref:F-box domain-containing protein n=1 Tax=Aspergillus avenaceus TaxID=36643 RepID=A0A5N6TWS6_ASPAV|nr:hypothetical protein BDV25DRAFT_139570 [Aspergillus avenaceus]